MKIETYLPLFSGFYGTLFANDDYEIADYNDYKIKVAEFLCKEIKNELKDFGVINIEFQIIISPKYYNLKNDSINCEIEINSNKISEYINDNFEEFAEYLKNNYTSYDGFISSYSNNIFDWINLTNNFIDFENCKPHYLGAVLEFICQNEMIEEYYFYQKFMKTDFNSFEIIDYNL